MRALVGPKRGHQVDRYEHSLQTATRAQRSFDPDYDTLPFEAFEPMVRRRFARQPDHFV